VQIIGKGEKKLNIHLKDGLNGGQVGVNELQLEGKKMRKGNTTCHIRIKFGSI